MKGLTSQQLEKLDCHVILGNTYHLANRPGSKTVADLGGMHKFINWKRGMLTDSGGFQVFTWSSHAVCLPFGAHISQDVGHLSSTNERHVCLELQCITPCPQVPGLQHIW